MLPVLHRTWRLRNDREYRQIDRNLTTNFCIRRINLAYLRSLGNPNYPSRSPEASANLLLLLASRNSSWSRADVIFTTHRVDTRNFGRLYRHYRASTFRRAAISVSLTGCLILFHFVTRLLLNAEDHGFATIRDITILCTICEFLDWKIITEIKFRCMLLFDNMDGYIRILFDQHNELT